MATFSGKGLLRLVMSIVFLSLVQPLSAAPKGSGKALKDHKVIAVDFRKILELQTSLREQWARIIAEAMNSNKSPIEILSYFPKGKGTKALSGMEVLERKYKSLAAKPIIQAVNIGNIVFIREGDVSHRIEVRDAYPILSLQFDDRLFSADLAKTKEVNKLIDKLMGDTKSAGIQRDVYNFSRHLLHWTIPLMVFQGELSNADGFSVAAAMIAGAAIGGGSTSYRSSVTVNIDTRPTAEAIDRVNQTLQGISASQQAMVRVQSELASVSIPGIEMDLAARVQKDRPDLSAEIGGTAQRSLEQKYGAAYAPLLVNMRARLDRGNLEVTSCQSRSDSTQAFSSLGSSDGLVFRQSRTPHAENSMDVEKIQIGETTFEITMRPSNPIHPVSSANQEIAAAKVCDDRGCSNLDPKTVAGRMNFEVLRQKFPKIKEAVEIKKIAESLSALVDGPDIPMGQCGEWDKVVEGGSLGFDAMRKNRENYGFNSEYYCTSKANYVDAMVSMHQKYSGMGGWRRWQTDTTSWPGCERMAFDFLYSLGGENATSDHSKQQIEALAKLSLAKCGAIVEEKKLTQAKNRLGLNLRDNVANLMKALREYEEALTQPQHPENVARTFSILEARLSDTSQMAAELQSEKVQRCGNPGSETVKKLRQEGKLDPETHHGSLGRSTNQYQYYIQYDRGYDRGYGGGNYLLCTDVETTPQLREVAKNISVQLKTVGASVKSAREEIVRIADRSVAADQQSLCCKAEYCRGKFEKILAESKALRGNSGVPTAR